MPHSKETPAETIKRLERELAEEKLRNQIQCATTASNGKEKSAIRSQPRDQVRHF